MEIATFIKEILSAMIWPVFAFYLSIKFKNEFSLVFRKLLNIDKINYKDFTAEFSTVEENSKLIAREIVTENDKDLEPKINDYIAKYAIVDQTKQIIGNYLDKYGILNRTVAASLIANNFPNAKESLNYLEIALNILHKQNEIKISNDTIMKI